MKKAWLIAALAFLPTQSSSLTTICSTYVSWHNPSIKVVETKDNYRVTWERYDETYEKTYTKRFGMLMDAGFTDPSGKSGQTVFMHDNINGIDVIIMDSIVMVPICSGQKPGEILNK